MKKVVLKMERPMPLGYSAAGIVEQVGEDARPAGGRSRGNDRVMSNRPEFTFQKGLLYWYL